MAAISTGIALASTAIAGVGLYQKYQGDKASQQAAQQQSAIAGQQSALQARYAIEQAAFGRDYSISQAGASRDYAISQAAANRTFQTQQAELEAQTSTAQTGINIAGANLSAEMARRSAELQKSTIGYEQQLEATRKTAMNLDYRRNQREALRIGQRTQAAALAAASSQGATRSSGLAGGRAQATAQTGFNLLGLQQGLELGNATFDINAGISQNRITAAGLESEYAQRRADLTTQNANVINQYAQTRAANTTAFYGSQYDSTSAFAESQYRATGAASEAQYRATAAFSAANAGYTGQYAQAGSNLFTGQAQSQFGGMLFQSAPYAYQFGSNIAKQFQSPTTPTPNYQSSQSNAGDNWFW